MNTAGEIQRILVVDHTKVVADGLTAMLCACGFRARAEYSAAGAMMAARDMSPDTVIADAVNGSELACYFAQYHPACTVLLTFGDTFAPSAPNPQPPQQPLAPSFTLELLASFAPTA